LNTKRSFGVCLVTIGRKNAKNCKNTFKLIKSYSYYQSLAHDESCQITKSGQIRKTIWSKSQKQRSGDGIQKTGETIPILESWMNGMMGYKGYVLDGSSELLSSVV
jgi:hypothetical protein